MNKQNYDGLTLNQLAERNAEHVTAIGRLEAQVKQLAAENAVILQDRAAILEAFDDTCVDIGMRRGEMAEQYPVPVAANTDAVLASLRAEGVEMFALMYAEEAIKDGCETTAWKSRASAAASEYASQLRSQSEQVKGVQS